MPFCVVTRGFETATCGDRVPPDDYPDEGVPTDEGFVPTPLEPVPLVFELVEVGALPPLDEELDEPLAADPELDPPPDEDEPEEAAPDEPEPDDCVVVVVVVVAAAVVAVCCGVTVIENCAVPVV